MRMLDPVGPCRTQFRIQMIVRELRVKRLMSSPGSPNRNFIIRTEPGPGRDVKLLCAKTALVIVPDNQLSLAGKEGQNARPRRPVDRVESGY